MRLSKKAEYALRALFAMARAPGIRLHSIQDLSREEKIPVKFLEQILLALKNAGILQSKRGVGGGYSLSRSPGNITVGEVIRLMDGPFASIPCLMPPPREPCGCADPLTCPLRVVMAEVGDNLSRILDGRSLEEAMRLAQAPDGMHFEI